MSNASTIERVRQQLASGARPTADQTEALLAMIDTLQEKLQAAIQTIHALQVSESRYRSIADRISDYAYIFRVEEDGRLIHEWLTEAFTKITGYTPQEFDLIESMEQLIYPDDLPIWQQHLSVLLGGNQDEREFRLVSKAGAIRWLYNCARPVWDEAQSRVVQILGAASDITDRKQAEERLQFLANTSALIKASLDYDATLDQVAHLAVPFLADGCFIDLLGDSTSPRRLIIAHADPEKERLLCEASLRYPIEADWPQPINAVVQSRRSALLASIDDSILQDVSRDEAELNMFRQLHFRSAMIVPLLAHDRLFGTILFVSEREQHRYTQHDLALAEELGALAAMALDNARLYGEAQAAVEARNEFLSIAAHELKTPTAALISATQLVHTWLVQEPTSSNRVKRELEVIAFAAQRLNKQIDALTEFAQLLIGQFTIDRQPVVLCSLARQVLNDLQPSPRHYVALFCADESLTIPGDAVRLEQALYNLVQNAIKYSPQGGPITVQIEQRDDQALIRVTDHGIGIPESARPHLFQRFYRASNAIQQHIGGMGIGLYLVNEIVTRHEGTVEVNSMEGYGSTFIIRLPTR